MTERHHQAINSRPRKCNSAATQPSRRSASSRCGAPGPRPRLRRQPHRLSAAARTRPTIHNYWGWGRALETNRRSKTPWTTFLFTRCSPPSVVAKSGGPAFRGGRARLTVVPQERVRLLSVRVSRHLRSMGFVGEASSPKVRLATPFVSALRILRLSSGPRTEVAGAIPKDAQCRRDLNPVASGVKGTEGPTPAVFPTRATLGNYYTTGGPSNAQDRPTAPSVVAFTKPTLRQGALD